MADTCPVCLAELQAGLSACPYCGFKLLGVTEEFEPISIDKDTYKDKLSNSTEATLRVLRGPQIGMSYKLGLNTSSLGRNPQSAIFLNDMTVSRQHARIEYIDGCHVVFDENSYNGVWVNNKSVESKALAHGDHIQIGTFLLKYIAE